jgi:2-C-methyl-D-erythritol 4-phosphate cytidylyltransferase
MGRDKNLLHVAGKTVLEHTVRAFENHPEIQSYLVLASREKRTEYETLLSKLKLKKFWKVIIGGEERQDSMRNGLAQISKNTDIVVFHNAANPLVTPQEISEVIKAAKQHGAAAVGVPARDTLRRVDGKGFSQGVVPREGVWQMQTPQAIKYELAVEAFNHAYASKEPFKATDDVALVENLHKPVAIVKAHPHNFKVTIPEDIPIAEAALRARQK